MIEAAAIVSAIIGHWDDFIIIIILLLFNALIELWQDRKASNALAALKKGLAPEAIALRDGKFQTIPASQLVPGDIVKIRLGQIVPADMRFVNGDYASIDQAALTGESLPVTKKIGDEAYSGSIVKQGEMAGVNILCSDKTGTLTQNQLTLGDTHLLAAHDEQEVILKGALASRKEDNDPIDMAVISALKDQAQLQNWVLDKFVPFDPVSKRIEAHLHNKQNSEKLWVIKGAPQVVAKLSGQAAVEKQVADITNDLAGKGYRALGVAQSEDEGKTWTVLGVLSIFDPPRDDSQKTIDQCKREGISVKMIWLN